jgi:PadR family transcriptional regulator PadR
MDRQLKKGLLEGCVLASLKHAESYGYKIISDVSPYIELSESTLYPILRRLENSGFLYSISREYNGRLRKYYGITPAGRMRLSEFLSDMDELVRVYGFICKR